jgi:alginate O-acetyltransferase complex protein AlgI
LVFTSHIFLYYFLPIALALYYLSLPITKRVWGGSTALVLTLTSYVFYGWNRPDYCLLMLGSSLLDYCCGIGIVRDQRKGSRGTRFLWCSMLGNLGLLAYFKYANLGVESWNALMGAVGAPGAAVKDWEKIALPVGISFYTFQTMSYTIDLWRKSVVPARNFWDFMAYVSMYPQLVAGPIVRYSHVMHELVVRHHTFDRIYRGVLFFQFGLVKKVLIADALAQIADPAFGSVLDGTTAVGPQGAIDAWVGALAYTFQIYFDFSGYSDMAIGLGLLLGFNFPINFDRPYLATSITDFWRRWHLSLSTWLRDYLYISLGGNRSGELRTYGNLLLTMLLGGLWHGANWTFVVWGAYQGFWLVVERAFRAQADRFAFLPIFVRRVATFALVVCGWVWFKSPDIPTAIAYFESLFGAHGAGGGRIDVRPIHAVAFASAAAATWCFPTSQSIVARAAPLYVVLVQPLFVVSLIYLHWASYVPFLYFQF